MKSHYFFGTDLSDRFNKIFIRLPIEKTLFLVSDDFSKDNIFTDSILGLNEIEEKSIGKILKVVKNTNKRFDKDENLKNKIFSFYKIFDCDDENTALLYYETFSGDEE